MAPRFHLAPHPPSHSLPSVFYFPVFFSSSPPLTSLLLIVFWPPTWPSLLLPPTSSPLLQSIFVPPLLDVHPPQFLAGAANLSFFVLDKFEFGVFKPDVLLVVAVVAGMVMMGVDENLMITKS